MPTNHRAVLKEVRSFPSLIRYLRNEMGWPIDSDDFEEVTFEYTTEELGIDPKSAAKIKKNGIKRLRPLTPNQPWSIFFIEFEPKRLPVVALRRILSQVVLKKRATGKAAERTAWAADDLLFVSNYGEGDARQITFAHFSQNEARQDLPSLKVLGWDNLDTLLHLDDVVDKLTRDLAWPKNDNDVEAWRKQWRAAFALRHREVVTTSKALAIRLAELARDIRDRIKTVLAFESDKGPVTRLMKAFQEALIHDLNSGTFADMYAQTIAYGLLSARIADPHTKTADDLAGHMRTNPFLRELMEAFLKVGGRRGKAGGPGIDFDELGVSEVVELLDDPNTHMEAVVSDFDDRNPQEDPVIHFYELFLNEYDKRQKVSRGVFYTPRPVVSYIVRSVDGLLRSEFGLMDGLADTTTWRDMAERHKGLKIPDGVLQEHDFVQVLDPATGTGTFLVEVIDVIHKTLVAKWKAQGHGEQKIDALWNEYVPKHLLTRLHGYELLMAPYAIAHLKIGLKLYETGYRFGSDERARIYLTNALEPAHDFSGHFQFAIPALAHEAQSVNEIKRKQRFTVVIGNPPYSNFGQLNRIPFILKLLEDYKRGLDEKKLNLDDDFIKFMRFAQWSVSKSDVGIMGFITNSIYLEGATHRQMRCCLAEAFSRLCVVDLNGDGRKQRKGPGGVQDENVFDIMQGVALSLFARAPGRKTPATLISAKDLVGPRSNSPTGKYEWLSSHDATTTDWSSVALRPPNHLFVAKDWSFEDEYLRAPSISEVFSIMWSGIQTKRDALTVDWTVDQAWKRIERAAQMKPADLLKEFSLPEDGRDWKAALAIRDLRDSGPNRKLIVRFAYRPLDTRFIYYTGRTKGWIAYPRREASEHLLKTTNVALIVKRSRMINVDYFCHVCVVDCPPDINYLADQTYFLPLYTASAENSLIGGTHRLRTHNVSLRIRRRFAEALSLDFVVDGGGDLVATFGPEDILRYTYAVLHAPSYRSRYADLLKADFPRLPLPDGVALFCNLVHLGGELVALHLMKSPKLDDLMTIYTGPNAPEVGRVSWLRDTVWLDGPATKKGQPAQPGTIGFHGVPESVWNFHIGGYQVCQKWLDYRKGRKLSKGEIEHYQKIVLALSETIRIMGEIDQVIQAHGGWPAAFQAGGLDATAPLNKVAEERQHPYEDTAAS